MSARRRMGPADSDVSNALLDATERVMRADGYGAATSRRIAEEAGLKQQLVYYYFRTMDELLLATFRRRTARALTQLKHDVAQDRPIRAIWDDMLTRGDGRLNFEFVALANHHAGIREEVARFMAEARRLQASAIDRQLRARGVDPGPARPPAIAFAMYAVSLMLGREGAMGIGEGHGDVRALADWLLGQVD